MRKFLLLSAGFCLLLGRLSAMPVQKLPNDKTRFKACDLNFSFMLVDSKWRGGKFRNAVHIRNAPLGHRREHGIVACGV